MSSFDPSITSQTIAPNLTTEERLNYLVKERELIEEMLERNSLRKRWCHAISTYSSLYESLLSNSRASPYIMPGMYAAP